MTWPAGSGRSIRRCCWPANAVDFDDLLVHLARLLADDPDLRASLDARHRFILVDEYQDTNAVQYCHHPRPLDRPSEPRGDGRSRPGDLRLAGASIRNILEFERDYPAARVVTLEHNYRSTANILGTADRLIANNSRRKPKRLVTAAPPGDRVRIVLDASGQDEAERIAAEIAAAIEAGSRGPARFRHPVSHGRPLAFSRDRTPDRPACPTSWFGASSSSSGGRSGTWWPGCGCSAIPVTTRPFCGSSTCRPAASAGSRSTGWRPGPRITPASRLAAAAAADRIPGHAQAGRP